MVVDRGPQVEAWGIYPGGQSGHPGSDYYDNAVNDWVASKYYRLHFPKTSGEAQGTRVKLRRVP